MKTTHFVWGSLTFRPRANTTNSEELRTTSKLSLVNLNWLQKQKQATTLIGNIWHQAVNWGKLAQLHWKNAAASFDTRRWFACGVLPQWDLEDFKPAALQRCSWLNVEWMASPLTLTACVWSTSAAGLVLNWLGLQFHCCGVEHQQCCPSASRLRFSEKKITVVIFYYRFSTTSFPTIHIALRD